MLLKDGKSDLFMLAVLSASKKLSWKMLKKIINSKNINIANVDEVK